MFARGLCEGFTCGEKCNKCKDDKFAFRRGPPGALNTFPGPYVKKRGFTRLKELRCGASKPLVLFLVLEGEV